MLNLNINKKTLLFSILLLIIGIVLSLFYDEVYRDFIRRLFTLFNGNYLKFVGKNFHLFASPFFTITFGIFLMFSFLIIQASKRKVLQTVLIIFIFLITNVSISFIESKLWAMECTACDDGIRNVNFNELPYDKYLAISTVITIALILIMKRRKNENKSNMNHVKSTRQNNFLVI